MFTNLCALHARYPACRSTISVSLDCLKDDRASKFIPSLEIDVIHRGAPGDKRRIRTIFERHPAQCIQFALQSS